MKCLYFLALQYFISITRINANRSQAYIPVAALDEYGQSSQLRNALLASSKHGKLVIAAISEPSESEKQLSPSIVVCSFFDNSKNLGVINHDIPKSLINVICKGDDDCDCSYTALVCSGFKSDTILLVKLLREYAQRVWDYYDIVAGSGRVAEALAEIKLTCMGYNVEDEVTDGAGSVILDSEFSMARPFGVSSFVLGIDALQKYKRASLITVDPSGVMEEWKANALGRHSDEARKMLECRWSPGMSAKEVRDMCVAIIQKIYLELDESIKGSIFCETLTDGGVEKHIFPLSEI